MYLLLIRLLLKLRLARNEQVDEQAGIGGSMAMARARVGTSALFLQVLDFNVHTTFNLVQFSALIEHGIDATYRNVAPRARTITPQGPPYEH